MAMNATDLGNTLYSRLKTDMGFTGYADKDLMNLKAFCIAITDEIVKHIQENAVVSSNTISVNGGTSGASPYIGPVTGAVGVLDDGAIT